MAAESRRAVVLQSSYIPWKGYFDLMDKADVFIVYDSVQFSKQSWRNRNKIRSESGTSWLSIPVQTSGRLHQPIDEVEIADRRWANKHWSKIDGCLRDAPHFANYSAEWRSWFEAAEGLTSLHEINMIFLRGLAESFGITTEIRRDREVGLSECGPTDRLVALCESVDANAYLTGPAGLDYLERDKFGAAEIALEVIDYSTYPEYGQTMPGFEHAVTSLDLLANVGASASEHLVGSIDRLTI